MIKIFERIREVYKKYDSNSIRHGFGDLIKRGDYEGALSLAEQNCKRNAWEMSEDDISRLRAGFNEYQIRLINLEKKLK
jgi:hypothetical protein